MSLSETRLASRRDATTGHYSLRNAITTRWKPVFVS